jgi:hypothetical protein
VLAKLISENAAGDFYPPEVFCHEARNRSQVWPDEGASFELKEVVQFGVEIIWAADMQSPIHSFDPVD